MTDILRVAVIGAGRMGADHIKRLSTRIHGAEVAAVVDVDLSRAQAAIEGIDGAVALASADEALNNGDVNAVLIAGTAYALRSPVEVFAPMFFIEARLAAGAELALPTEHAERGVYVVEGKVDWGELALDAAQMAVQGGPTAPSLRARESSLLMLFGGAPLDGDRHLWWNFVAATRERIEQAKIDWREQRFARVVGDEDEFIPLPD